MHFCLFNCRYLNWSENYYYVIIIEGDIDAVIWNMSNFFAGNKYWFCRAWDGKDE